MPNFPTSLAADSSMLKAQNWKSTTLRAAMDSTQTTVPVTDATVFPDPAGATWYVAIEAIDSTKRELVSYTGRDLTGGANALTGVTRHVDGNTIGHSSGVAVELNVAAQFHEALKGEILAVQTKVGVDGSATTTTHDYKLSGVTGADKAASKTGTETLTGKTINGGTFDEIIISAAASRIRPGATSLSLRNNANSADNLIITDAGAATFRSTVGGITTLTATTLAGTLSTAAQTNVTSVGTLTGLTINGNLSISAAAGKIIPGSTSISLRNNADGADNLIITDAGAITVRSTISGVTTLTATTLAGTLSTAAQASVTSLGTLTSLTIGGNLTFTGGSRKLIASTTNFAIRDSGDTANNILVADGGDITVRASLIGTTSLAPATAFTITGTGSAVYARQYASTRFAVAFSTTPTYDWNNGNVQSTTLTGNITTMTLSNPQDGGRYILLLLQDGTGGRTVTWPASVKWSGGTAPTLSALNKLDQISMIWNGTNYISTQIGEF